MTHSQGARLPSLLLLPLRQFLNPLSGREQASYADVSFSAPLAPG